MMDDTPPTENVYPNLSTSEGDNAAEVPIDSAAEIKRKELEAELQKTEEEIATLRQVLHAKEQHASALKNQLGLTTMSQLKAEINKVQTSQAYQNTSAKVSELNEKVTSSAYYKKTSETLKTAGQATATAFNALGTSMSNKFSEMKNSPTFKSFEEKVEGVGTTIMSKVSGVPKDANAENSPSEGGAPESPVTKQPHAADDLPM